MPVFEVEANGKTFEVEAPDQAAALSALGGMKPEKPKYTGSVLPFSESADGKLSFDSNAGIMGSIKSGLGLAGDVNKGTAKLPSSGAVPGSVPFGDPESAGLRVADMATLATPTVPRSAAGAATKAVIPNARQIADAAKQGYKAVDDLGFKAPAEAGSQLSTLIGATLERSGLNGKLAPKTFSILDDLKVAPEGSFLTASNFDTIRKTLGNAARDFQNPAEQKAASRAIELLDDALASLNGQVGKTFKDARGNYAALKRSEQITDAGDAAELGAAAANSGANVGNRTRQKIASILGSDKKSSGYSPDELAQMERIVKGTATGNTARTLGNLLGGGGGLGATVSAAVGAGTGMAVGGPVGAAVGAGAPIAGALLKMGENASTNRQMKILEELIRSRSPLAEEMAKNVDKGIPYAKKAALIRALAESQQQQ